MKNPEVEDKEIPDSWLLFTCVFVLVCLFFSPGGSERKKWFGIIAKRAGKRVCLRMEGKNYQKGAGWN